MQRITRPRSSLTPLSFLLLVILTGCGANASSGSTDAGGGSGATVAVDQPFIATENGPCRNGRLVVGRLDEVQPAWDRGIAAASQQAEDWQRDARLVEARITCGFLKADAVVKATFYSDTARTLFFSYTGETQPVDPGVPAPPLLVSDGVAFSKVKAILLEAGFDDDAEVHPSSGVNVRYNGTTTPFGPSAAPEETIILHLILVQDGMVQDVFIDAASWQIVKDDA